MSVEMIDMDKVEPEEIEWLYFPYIPSKKVTILCGEPGEGKTTFILNLIAQFSKGIPFGCMQEKFEPVNSIYQTAEDGLADTIKPRLMECNADCTKIKTIDESKEHLSFRDDRIEEAIVTSNAKIMVLDPIQAYIGDNVDMNSARDVRYSLRNLSDIAQRTGCAIILIAHLNKQKDSPTCHRILGSVDFVGAVRSVLYIGRSKKNQDILYCAPVKSNLAKKGSTMVFYQKGSRLSFEGLAEISCDDLMSNINQNTEIKPTKVQSAIEIMQDILDRAGEMLATDVIEEMKRNGIGERTVRKAKDELRVRSVKKGSDWYWTLKKE